MLALFMLAALVVPGVVAAAGGRASPAGSALEDPVGSTSDPLDQVAPIGDAQADTAPAAGLCSSACTTNTQCRQWCGEPANCVRDPGSTIKHCIIL